MKAPTITCAVCGNEFPRPTTRGRPPKKCQACRIKPMEIKEKIEGVERYEQLEISLKARGTHLSQQKEKW